MAYVRTEPTRPEGFVDPSNRYTEEQLNSFYERLQNGDPELDETIDIWLHKKSDVTVLEILQSDKYKDKLWKIHQPVCPCCITYFDTYLENFYEWFNIGRVAWRLLAVLSDLDRKVFRENHLSGVAGEIDHSKQLLDKYKEGCVDGEEKDELDGLSELLDEYANFLNDITSGRIVSKRHLGSDIDDGSLKQVEHDLRESVVEALNDLIYESGYDLKYDIGEDHYKTFVEDAEGLLIDISDTEDEEPLYVPKVFKD